MQVITYSKTCVVPIEHIVALNSDNLCFIKSIERVIAEYSYPFLIKRDLFGEKRHHVQN